MRRLVCLWRSVCHEPIRRHSAPTFQHTEHVLEPEPPPPGLFAGAVGQKHETRVNISVATDRKCNSSQLCDYSDCTFTGRGCSLSSLLLLYGFEFSFILFLFSVPLLPVVENAIQHGLDLRVEARKLLRKKKVKDKRCSHEDKWKDAGFYFHLTVYCVQVIRQSATLNSTL